MEEFDQQDYGEMQSVMREQVTILIYTFPKPGAEEEAFAKIAAAIERTWRQIGRLKTVIVASHRFAAVERFVADHGEVGLQVEPTIIPGDIASMSYDCIVRLYRRFSTPYVLIVQDDGYPIRPGLEAFVGRYDFIGAPSARDGRRKWMNRFGFPCLNGGFSLRSRRICISASRNWRGFWRFFIPKSSNFFAEDTFYTVTACLNPFYRWRHHFANEQEAFLFSYDSLFGLIQLPDLIQPFGFHRMESFDVLSVK